MLGPLLHTNKMVMNSSNFAKVAPLKDEVQVQEDSQNEFDTKLPLLTESLQKNHTLEVPLWEELRKFINYFLSCSTTICLNKLECLFYC